MLAVLSWDVQGLFRQLVEDLGHSRLVSLSVRALFIKLLLQQLICIIIHSWWNRELTLKCKFKCYVKPMKDPLGVSPSKGNQGTTRGKEKFLLTSMGIEPTTSGLDLPLLCRHSYEVGQRESGTIKVVNRGEEKVRVHMNVVPHSAMNTNGRTEN